MSTKRKPRKTPLHPNQPVYLDEHGVARFKENRIVVFLLDTGGTDLNRLAMMSFSQDDREQFAQLIGYSVSGFSDLDYASDRRVEDAEIALASLINDWSRGNKRMKKNTRS